VEAHRQVEDQAAAFLARRDGDDWTERDQAELERWLAGSTARRVAFLRLEAAWDEARRLKALSAGLTPGTVPPPGEWRNTPFFDSNTTSMQRADLVDSPAPSPSRPGARGARDSRLRPRARHFALAATILLALGIGAYFLSGPQGNRYSTPIGGIASVPLSDGSHITLNTASEVRVELTPSERHIRLEEGEAFFDVAHDANRPFIVQVGKKLVIAVGTKFSVRREGHDVRIVVTEGKVRVETGSAAGGEGSSELGRTPNQPGEYARGTAYTRAVGPGEAFLTPGDVASVGDDGIVIEQRPVAEVQDDLSWRQGYLTFHDTSLADAVAEFNRYNTHQIVIEDPAVAAIRISGSFRALNYEAFVRVLDDGFAIHSRSSEDTTTLGK
jgi:transmembrane sensor